MKTTYRPRNNASGKKRFSLVAGVFLIGAALLFFLRGPLLTGIAPLWKGSNALSESLSTFLGLFSSKASLVEENESLKQKLASQEYTIMSLRAAADSREELLRVYGRTATSTGIAATVLVHPPETPYDVLIIDAGTEEGVLVGNKVYLPEGEMIGEIVDVASHTSRVDMNSTSGKETQAVLERNMTPITLIGQGGGNFKVDLPKDILVETGDRVLAPGIGNELIGMVGNVETTPTDSVEHVRIRSVANATSVHFVLIKP